MDHLEEKVDLIETSNKGKKVTKLVAIVSSQEEADLLNIDKMNKIGSKGSNQTHNLDSGYGSEDHPNFKTIKEDSNSDYEDEDDVKSLERNQYSPPVISPNFEVGRISRLTQ